MKDKILFNLNDLFSKKIFRIPDYQRGYSWERIHLSEFWTDLLNVYQSGQQYYTGMLSFHELKSTEVENWDTNWLTNHGTYTACHIVDGQQRLTTIEILIKTIINICEDNKIKTLNGEDITYYKQQYLERINPITGKKSFIFGYEVDEESDDYFKYEIMKCEGSIELVKTIYTRNLLEAKEFFETKMDEFLRGNDKEIDINKALPKLERLFSVLTINLMFNSYSVDDNFNPFLAFETMNNRGKKLSNLELLKNRLIYLSTLFKIEDTEKKNVRNSIDKAWKEIYKQLGSNPDYKLDDEEYLKNHWIIYFGYNRAIANAYSNFLLKKYFIQQNIDGFNQMKVDFDETALYDQDNNYDYYEEEKADVITPSSITNYLNSIQSLSSKWAHIKSPDLIVTGESEELKKLKIILERLKQLGQGYFLPLILVIYNNDSISNTKKIEIFEKIEKYQLLQFRIFNNSPSSQNSVFYKLAYDIYHSESEEELESLIVNCINNLNEIDNIENGYIDSAIVKTFSSRLFKNNGFYDWGSKHYVLFEYEQFLRGDSEFNHINPKEYFLTNSKTISIEHIYPQTPTHDSWIKAFDKYDDEQRSRLLNSIGNLMPLSLRINSKMQNIPFEEKKKEIKDDSGAIIRAGYESGSYNEREVFKRPEWNAKEILRRGIKILNFMEFKWEFKLRTFEDKKTFLGLDFLEYREEDLRDSE